MVDNLLGNRGFSASSDTNESHYLPGRHEFLELRCHFPEITGLQRDISPMWILLGNEFFKHANLFYNTNYILIIRIILRNIIIVKFTPAVPLSFTSTRSS